MVTIEPIKNQYLTALKERQQIIDKLNEIITGLNALNFDDLTTIQSELVSIRESLQTQNTAITEINKSIGQIESELTSFDNRLITLNTNIENTESHLTSFENDTTLNLQSKVNKNGDTMTGNLGIPTTETGTRNNLAVNGERLQNDLDNYSPMVRTTGQQITTGLKMGVFRGYIMDTPPARVTSGKWLRYAGIQTSYIINIMEMWGQRGNNGYCYSRAITGGAGSFIRIGVIDNIKLTGNTNEVWLSINQTTNLMEIWILCTNPDNVVSYVFFNSQSDKNPTYYNEEHNEKPTENYGTWVQIS